MNITDRFLKYVSFATTSDENTGLTPSTPGQMVLAKYIVEELKGIGLVDANVDENGYVMASLPANSDEKLPTIGFIAHLDTSPDMSGKNIQPRIVKYEGGDIVLNQEENIVLSLEQFPELAQYKGQDIIVTNGKTLLGADDKAGIAEIVTAVEYLIQHPEIKHGKVCVAFTPDEEIGQGSHHFDVARFGADWAYTMDGGEIGELEYENFNAASAKVLIKGCNVHPGYAKNKMLNALRVANQFAALMPENEVPEQTEGYEGFYHLVGMNGGVEEASLTYIIRDHNRELFEQRKTTFAAVAAKINAQYGEGTATVEVKDQYYNMREKIEPVMHIIDLALKAMEKANIRSKVQPIRGGTDGAQLSFKGLPCPNIFAGGHNFHGRYEYLPIPSMEKAAEVVLNIITLNQPR
ncbi:MAG: peptidase T [Paludibacteraceae bacterium]|nr:peptidase T [Paludibacteraceae bacterium]